MPESISSIGYRAFHRCNALNDVYYGGTKEQWEQISVGEDNGDLSWAAIHYEMAENVPCDDGHRFNRNGVCHFCGVLGGSCGEDVYWALSEDGVLIIRDIDDGLNYAFPDDTRDFERIVKMCDHDQQSGNRRNGRQIYYQLRKAGFTRITLERQGFSSVGMNDAQKQTMFQLYFPFTLENARIMSEKFPKNPEYREDYLWYHSCFEDIHKKFMDPDFVFSFGFVSYTARK